MDVIALIDRQIDAYNARDLHAFVATYHSSVELFIWPDIPRLNGIEALRNEYAVLFHRAKDLYARVEDRLSMGACAVYVEHISGHPVLGTMRLMAVYEVKEGLIRRVCFILPGADTDRGQAA